LGGLRIHLTSFALLCRWTPVKLVVSWVVCCCISIEFVWNNNAHCPCWYTSATVQSRCFDWLYNVGYNYLIGHYSQQSSQKSVFVPLPTRNSIEQWKEVLILATLLQNSETCLFSQGLYVSSCMRVTYFHHLSWLNHCHIHLARSDWFIMCKSLISSPPFYLLIVTIHSARSDFSFWNISCMQGGIRTRPIECGPTENFSLNISIHCLIIKIKGLGGPKQKQL
jgi:hypothetical protein